MSGFEFIMVGFGLGVFLGRIWPEDWRIVNRWFQNRKRQPISDERIREMALETVASEEGMTPDELRRHLEEGGKS